MLLLGVHRINKGKFDSTICKDIMDSKELACGAGAMYGHGIYAYYPDKVPSRFRGDAFVVFQALYQNAKLEIKNIHIPGIMFDRDTLFFILPAEGEKSRVPINILGFVNCPGFSEYNGNLMYY